MKSITKAVLATELAAARARICQLEGQIVAERALHRRAINAVMVDKAMAVPAPVARIKPAMPQWQIDRALAMKAARDMAMKSNHTVKV